jgi:hypothetical protein
MYCRDELRSHHRHHHHSSGSNNVHLTNNSNKKQRLDITKTTNGSLNLTSSSSATTTTITDSSMDVNSSDNMVAVAQLREKIIALDKQLKIKNSELVKKDVKVFLISLFPILIRNNCD